MKKPDLIPVIIIIILLVGVFTPFLITRTIGIEKTIFSSKGKVSIKYSDIGFGNYCTCQGPVLEIYHLENEEWEKILFHLPANYECVNGTVYGSPAMWCDVVVCGIQFVNNQRVYEWDIKMYEGEERTCGNQTYMHYEKVAAPKGEYRAKYGIAEVYFSIV